ncbi:hypothetical protein AMJ44_13395 [candidate division WOR-1 bacterium DG_54_3]|uniref:Ribosomal subunit interface protein n=1 Tax=candidate division WOR-1 bacterium DG_54_3 TaxID=1703775 RepID=A0A0S7XPY1_UNCSA|nr:MAG: hypothetical protein AMJ44_13395 [candidate division WOR-1 bacterium DG_54_3]
MQIRTTARHFDLTDDLKNFAEKNIEKLEKYFNHIIDSHLILDMEKSRMTAELKQRLQDKKAKKVQKASPLKRKAEVSSESGELEEDESDWVE